MWNEVKKLCIDACNITPEIGYIGWDVCVGPDEPCIIEGNDFPGHDLYQLPIHRKNGIGLLPKFKNAMEDKMNIVIATDHNGVEEKNVNPADFKLTNIQLGEGSPLLGHTSASASLRNKYSALVVAIQRGDEYLKPNGEVAFMPQDIVWMVGDVKRLAELR